jgi:hypothetical protein
MDAGGLPLPAKPPRARRLAESGSVGLGPALAIHDGSDSTSTSCATKVGSDGFKLREMSCTPWLKSEREYPA